MYGIQCYLIMLTESICRLITYILLKKPLLQLQAAEVKRGMSFVLFKTRTKVEKKCRRGADHGLWHKIMETVHADINSESRT